MVSDEIEEAIPIHSIVKTIHSLAIGKLITEGLLSSVDVPVCAFFPEWKQGNKKYVTIRHLLNNTSGLQNPSTDPDSELKDPQDMIQLVLCAEFSTMPGETYSYNNKAHQLVGGLISKIAHQPSHLYIEEKLFKPMDVKKYKWDFDGVGQAIGLNTTADGLLKIGILALQKGTWNGVQLILKTYLEQSVESGTVYGNYGLAWWLRPSQMTWVIDDDKIGLLKKYNLPVEYVQKAEQLKGIYTHLEDLNKKVFDLLGAKTEDFYQQITLRGMYLRRVETSNTILGYNASGWLGQYIYIVPEKNMIVVRTIKEKDHLSNTDDFYELENLVWNLSK